VSEKHLLYDDRIVAHDGNGTPFLHGPYYKRDSIGGNWAQRGDKTPHAYSSTVINRRDGTYTFATKEFSDPWVTNVYPMSLSASLERPWDNNDDIALLSQLAEKYRQHDWNLGVAAAEVGKTTDMVVTRVKQLTRVAHDIRRGNIRSAMHHMSVDPNTRLKRYGKSMSPAAVWLEARYGWRPLLKDIFDLADAIAKHDVPRTYKLRARHSLPYTPSTAFPTIFTAWGHGSYGKQIIAHFKEARPDPIAYLGLNNPLGIAWELVPYSFVVDWFYPLGNYLATRATLSGLSGTFVRTTRDFYRVGVSGMAGSYQPDHTPPYQSEYSDPHGYLEYCKVDRTITSELGVPPPVLRNPIGASPVKRAADAITLFGQAIGRFIEHKRK
jgi:hypothetical protein